MGQYVAQKNPRDEFLAEPFFFKKSKELDAKKSLKEKLGVNGVTRISFYLDRIAATVPSQIQLTVIHVQMVLFYIHLFKIIINTKLY